MWYWGAQNKTKQKSEKKFMKLDKNTMRLFRIQRPNGEYAALSLYMEWTKIYEREALKCQFMFCMKYWAKGKKKWIERFSRRSNAIAIAILQLCKMLKCKNTKLCTMHCNLLRGIEMTEAANIKVHGINIKVQCSFNSKRPRKCKKAIDDYGDEGSWRKKLPSKL